MPSMGKHSVSARIGKKTSVFQFNVDAFDSIFGTPIVGTHI